MNKEARRYWFLATKLLPNATYDFQVDNRCCGWHNALDYCEESHVYGMILVESYTFDIIDDRSEKSQQISPKNIIPQSPFLSEATTASSFLYTAEPCVLDEIDCELTPQSEEFYDIYNNYGSYSYEAGNTDYIYQGKLGPSTIMEEIPSTCDNFDDNFVVPIEHHPCQTNKKNPKEPIRVSQVCPEVNGRYICFVDGCSEKLKTKFRTIILPWLIILVITFLAVSITSLIFITQITFNFRKFNSDWIQFKKGMSPYRP